MPWDAVCFEVLPIDRWIAVFRPCSFSLSLFVGSTDPLPPSYARSFVFGAEILEQGSFNAALAYIAPVPFLAVQPVAGIVVRKRLLFL